MNSGSRSTCCVRISCCARRHIQHTARAPTLGPPSHRKTRATCLITASCRSTSWLPPPRGSCLMRRKPKLCYPFPSEGGRGWGTHILPQGTLHPSPSTTSNLNRRPTPSQALATRDDSRESEGAWAIDRMCAMNAQDGLQRAWRDHATPINGATAQGKRDNDDAVRADNTGARSRRLSLCSTFGCAVFLGKACCGDIGCPPRGNEAKCDRTNTTQENT